LRRFLAHYERLSRHALRTLPARADLRLVLDESRTVRTLVVQ
jgi:D-glycerate 3-kinase